ncbi:uncharacterized protein LOC134823408 isoform X2 [Bolinopsis microptera]|uniref:uncharacterized protein LOC134823408 isoform X2 n=1 Tax=Bolinopsis microptera TaxID=2820187 RepID=UPI00307A7EC4
MSPMNLIGLDLFLSVECSCEGEYHESTCEIQSRLPIDCPVAPNRWLIQYGRFLVRDEHFNPSNKPIVPHKSFREFRVTVKSPVKKSSKQRATCFVDVDLPQVAKHFMDWLVNELERSYGKIKYQRRLHLVLTNQQRSRLEESSQDFTQFKGTVRSILLVRERKDVNVKIEGLKNSLIIWSKDLRPTADTTVHVQATTTQLAIHRFKKQCYVGGFLILLFCVVIPTILYFSEKFKVFKFPD